MEGLAGESQLMRSRPAVLESPSLLALKAPHSVPIPRPALSSQNKKGDSYPTPGCHMVPCGPCSGGWPVPISPGRKGRGFLRVRQSRQEKPGLQHLSTSLAQHPGLPVSCHLCLPMAPAFSNPSPFPNLSQVLPLLG